MKNPLANRRRDVAPADLPAFDAAPPPLGSLAIGVADDDLTLPTPTVPPAGDPPAPVRVDDDLWPTGGPQKGMRLRLPVLVGAALVVGGLSFAGGATAYKHKNPVAAAAARTAAPGAVPGATPGAQGQAGGFGQGGPGANAGGAAGPGQGAGGRTTGTVSSVDGATVYVTDSSGNLVKVTIPDGTPVSATRPGTAADVRPGDTIILTGAKQPDGSTQASTVALNPGGSGFRGGGGTRTTG